MNSMSSRRNKLIALAAALPLTVGAGAAVVSATGLTGTEQAKTFAAGADAGPSQADPAVVNGTNVAGLAVFERGARPTDRPSADLVGREARTRGASLTSARNLLDRGSEQIFALPIRDGVCLASSSYVVQICLPDSVVAHDSGQGALRGFQASICSPYMAPEHIVLFGLIPNGVKDLRFVSDDGSEVSVPVENNFAYYQFAKGKQSPVDAVWTNAEGQTFTEPLPLPVDADAGNCDTTQTPAQAVDLAKREARAVAFER